VVQSKALPRDMIWIFEKIDTVLQSSTEEELRQQVPPPPQLIGPENNNNNKRKKKTCKIYKTTIMAIVSNFSSEVIQPISKQILLVNPFPNKCYWIMYLCCNKERKTKPPSPHSYHLLLLLLLLLYPTQTTLFIMPGVDLPNMYIPLTLHTLCNSFFSVLLATS
jgi:hypothetical protein